MRLTRTVAAVLAIVVAVPACSATPSPPPTNAAGNLVLPTMDTPPNTPCAGVGTEALLAGDADDPRVAWIVSRMTRVDVVFPSGFSARFAPDLEVLDASGRVVARAGDRIDGYCVTAGPPLILWP
jgi:hypothetical protein